MTRHACPKCGATLPGPDASCARCLLELAVEPNPEATEASVTTRARRAPALPPEPVELAPLFPELEIESLLGAGGMGAVYKARQKRLGRVVALKVLHGELSGDPVFVERFLREAQSLATLAHPGIVAIHDYGEREGRCFLVMEYVDGANLRVLLKQGLLAPRQTLDIVRQLCDALQFAHDEGIVHRDIKPENVLVDTRGRVKIADFGLAKLVGAPASSTLTEAGQVMGTPHYMAPEQVEHPLDVDHRADLFALGVVFYEMLTGELPLGRFAPPSQRVQIDVRLDEIVLKSLERERERRYQHAAQVKTDVERVEHEPARREQAPASKHGLHLRSGVYLPRLQSVLGGHRPTSNGWLALLGLAWIMCGAAFALGAIWFALVSVPLLAWLFHSMVAARTGLEPRPDEAIWRWIARFGPGTFLLAALGIVALFVAHVASWERWTWSYVASDQHPLAGLERWRGAEIELLRQAGIAPEDSADLAPADLRLESVSSHWLSDPYALFGLHPLVLAAVAVGLLAAAALVIAGASRRPSREWRAGVLSSLGLFFTSLAGVHLLFFAVHGGTQRLEGVQASLVCGGGAEELGQRLYRALVARELQVHAEHSARVVDRRSGDVLANVHLLAAGPASVFARWSMTWGGPRRLEPHVQYTVVSDAKDERALILADGGLVESAQLVTNAWMSELRELLHTACAAHESK